MQQITAKIIVIKKNVNVFIRFPDRVYVYLVESTTIAVVVMVSG